MNAFFWKRLTVIKNDVKKIILLFVLPVFLTVIYLVMGISYTDVAIISAISITLFSNILFWDLDDILNYEVVSNQPVSRCGILTFYIIVPSFLVYCLSLALSALICLFFSHGLNLSLGAAVLGAIFSPIAVAVNNAQIINYSRFVQFASVPYGLLTILFPFVSVILYSVFVAHFSEILCCGILIGVTLLMLFIKFYKKEECITSVARLASGYGDMND